MPSIHILSEEVRNRIAAGEVLERPAAAIKELVENSLDAGATRIEVEIALGGQELIRVSDDGTGISAEELPLAVLRHATSKITDVEDIFNIDSKGFRGEALPSIAAVSRMNISSRAAGEEAGHSLQVESGAVVGQEPCSRAVGTAVEVRDLFFNTPARKKFLKSAASEAGAVRECLVRLALAHPEVSLKYINSGKTVFDLPAHGNAIDRIEGLFGRSTASALAPVEFDVPGEIGITGFAAMPPESRATSRAIYTFVNRRWINHSSLTQAVRRSFDGLLPPRRYPVAFVFIGIDPSEIDVNVHPTKHDIRFHHERGVLSAVYKALSESLRNGGMRDEGEADSPPTTGADLSGPAIGNDSEAKSESFSANSIFNSAEQKTSAPFTASESPTTQPANLSGAGFVREPEAVIERPKPGSAFSKPASFSKPDLSAPGRGPTLSRSSERVRTSATSSMFDAAELKRKNFRVLAQAHDSYLVVECPDGLMLVDQHALHERIIYEGLRKSGDEIVSQKLLVPAVIELSSDEYDLFLEVRTELNEMGFSADEFGDRTVSVSAVPTVVAKTPARTFLRDSLAELSEGSGKRDSLREPLIKTMACKAAIKAGDRLPDEAVTSLLERLSEGGLPFTCPHGRPFAFVLPLSDIRRRFERT